jgi:transposase
MGVLMIASIVAWFVFARRLIRVWKWIRGERRLERLECPECRYPLRFNGTEYWCSECGYRNPLRVGSDAASRGENHERDV